MNDKFQKLIAKKKAMGKTLSPVETAAKGSVLEDLKGMAGQAMSDKLNGLKKVSVASDSDEGLKHGLEKAHEIVSGGAEHKMLEDTEGGEQDKHDMQGSHEGMTEGSPEEEASESPEEAHAEGDEESGEKEHEDMTPEELDQEIEKLKELKRAKSSPSIHKPY